MGEVFSLWSLSQLQKVIRDQWDLAKEFLRSPPLVVPVWFAFFGDAVHSPVLTFFFLQLGATERDIGVIGSYIDIGYLFAAPTAGFVMDRWGPHLAICAGCLLCGVGCVIRALATTIPELYVASLLIGLGGFHTTVMSLISKHTSRKKRTLVIGGYQIQLTILSLLGKMFYPIWYFILESVLKHFDVYTELLRDRITLNVCSLVCIIGATKLLFDDAQKYNTKFKDDDDDEGEEEKLQRKDVENPKVENATEKNSDDDTKASFFFLAIAVVLLATSRTIGIVLWPLYLRDTLDWGSRAYSCLLLVQSLALVFSLALVPSIESKFGRTRTLTGLALFGAVCTLAFSFRALTNYFLISFHVVIAVAFYASTSALETSLSSLASLNTPPSFTASTFGVLALLSGVGSILGHLAGTYMYSISKEPSDYVPDFLVCGTRLPFLVVALMLLLCLFFVFIAQKWKQSR